MAGRIKRKYSAINLEEAMQLVPAEQFTPWTLNAPLRLPSDTLQENLRRLERSTCKQPNRPKRCSWTIYSGKSCPTILN